MKFVKCNFRWCVNKRKLSKPTLLTYANWANIQPPTSFCYSKLFAFLLSQEESKNESFGLNSMHVLVPKMLACTSIYSSNRARALLSDSISCHYGLPIISKSFKFHRSLSNEFEFKCEGFSKDTGIRNIQDTKWQLLFIVKVM